MISHFPEQTSMEYKEILYFLRFTRILGIKISSKTIKSLTRGGDNYLSWSDFSVVCVCMSHKTNTTIHF